MLHIVGERREGHSQMPQIQGKINNLEKVRTRETSTTMIMTTTMTTTKDDKDRIILWEHDYAFSVLVL